MNNNNNPLIAENPKVDEDMEEYHDANDDFDLSFMNNNQNNDYDIELPENEYHSNSGSPTRGLLAGYEKDDQLAFNGGIIKVCQSRIKAPMVKRAIAAVISNKEVKSILNLYQFYRLT